MNVNVATSMPTTISSVEDIVGDHRQIARGVTCLHCLDIYRRRVTRLAKILENNRLSHVPESEQFVVLVHPTDPRQPNVRVRRDDLVAYVNNCDSEIGRRVREVYFAREDYERRRREENWRILQEAIDAADLERRREEDAEADPVAVPEAVGEEEVASFRRQQRREEYGGRKRDVRGRWVRSRVR